MSEVNIVKACVCVHLPCMHSKLKTISSEVRITSEKEPFLMTFVPQSGFPTENLMRPAPQGVK